MQDKFIDAVKNIGGLSAFSKCVGVKPPTARAWIYGKEGTPTKRCVQIEQLTNGAVTRKDLRPNDWWEIWPELITPEDDIPRKETD